MLGEQANRPTRKDTRRLLALGGLVLYVVLALAVSIHPGETQDRNIAGFAVAGGLIILFMLFCFESERRQARLLRRELERRATSDDLTGVSNRAHINLLAQNEFARARRYREPCALLMIEIDGYEELTRKWGAYVIVQVFTGYCVVVMRHCDSFGRLSPERFLAVLPETKGDGAFILAQRMCRDLAALDVAVEGQTRNFTVSIGAAELHANDRFVGDYLRRAGQALDDAIEHGRNNAVLAASPFELSEIT